MVLMNKRLKQAIFSREATVAAAVSKVPVALSESKARRDQLVHKDLQARG